MDLSKRQREILQASIELISVGGIQHFTTKALAAKIHVSEPAIYRHFESKLDILQTIILELKEENDNFSKKIREEKGSISHLEMMFHKHAEQFTSNPAKAAIIFSEEIFQNDKRLSDLVLSIMNDRHNIILSILKQEQKNGVIRNDIPAEQLTIIIMGTLRLIISKWRLNEYSSDLKDEMNNVWVSMEKILLQ